MRAHIMFQMYSVPILTLTLMSLLSFIAGFFLKPRRQDTAIILLAMLPLSIMAMAISMRALTDAGFNYIWFSPLILLLGEGLVFFFFLWGQTSRKPMK